jgi:DnaK suppressor protein
MMTEEKKQYFRELLGRWLDELLADEKNAVRGFAELKDGSPDLIDQASLDSDTDFAFRIRERESRLILKIKEALKRLDEGTFGICEECGEEILEGRLMARPITTRCIRCKRRQEAQERLRGL